MTNKKIKKGDCIAFRAIDETAETEFTPIGTVLGFGREVKELYPIACGTVPDDLILVLSTDHARLYGVLPSEVLEVIEPKQANLKAKRVGNIRRVK